MGLCPVFWRQRCRHSLLRLLRVSLLHFLCDRESIEWFSLVESQYSQRRAVSHPHCSGFVRTVYSSAPPGCSIGTCCSARGKHLFAPSIFEAYPFRRTPAERTA